ncbi:MAG: DHA2 family efflux MFS transporter permease subunit [Alphaproteobacteria bacterium]|nr:DHA2 family efflux MFS transporter permease subunit [Alphaproteobacteria bacterium]
MPTGARRVLITASVMAATLMQALDSTIANVALPRIQGSLLATQDQMSWVLTSYIVAAAITMPLTGWLAGRFGRKPVFLLSVAGFTVTSALCGIAVTLDQLVVYRFLQGVFGAGLVPLSQTVLFDINPPEHHGRAMSVWGTGVTLGPILGPVLGGWLTDNYNWRWVFYINLPVGVLAFFGIMAFLHDHKAHQHKAFDFVGFATLSLGVGALQLMLDRGELKNWFGSTEIVIEAVLMALGFYLFIVHTWTTKKHPFLSPGLMKDRNFVTGNVFIFMIGVVLYATLALLPPLLQNLMNYPVVTTGLVTAPRGIGSMIAMIVVGRLIGKIDARLIVAAGFGLCAFSLWQLMHISPQRDSSIIIWSGLIQGFGIGFAYVPLSTIAFATLGVDLRAEGTGLFNLLRNLGSSLGISVVQALLTENTQIAHAGLARNLVPGPLTDPMLQSHHFDVATPQGVMALNALVTKQAAMIAYIDDFKLMMIATLAILPLLLIIRGPKRKTAPPHVALD